MKEKDHVRHLILVERYRSENINLFPVELSLRLGAEKIFDAGFTARADITYRKLDYKESKDFDQYEARLIIGYTNNFLEL